MSAAAIYDKLNNVHASLRKTKEDALRSKQLAEERLRLARTDREAMERANEARRAQLRALKEKAGAMQAANGTREGENHLLEKEYNFQHAELQSKREKLSRLEDKRGTEARARRATLAAAREMLRRLRDESSRGGASGGAVLPPEERRRRLERMMEADGGMEVCGSLPRLVEMRKRQKAEDAASVEAKNAALRRIVAGYQNALGGSDGGFPQMGGGSAEVMQQ